MRATRVLRSMSNEIFRPKLILPTPTVMDQVGSAFRGVWATFTDQSARDNFETLISDRVINHDVVMSATNGYVLVFSLFDKLRNPLWAKQRFDGKEFLQTVGPALENFFDTTETLRNNLRESTGEKENLEEIQNRSPDIEELQAKELEKPGALAEALIGENHWRKQAEEDPSSLAADLLKMSSPQYFDSLYYVTKFGRLGGILDPERKVYEEGSCSIGGVAFLDARIMTMDKDERPPEETMEYPEFQASEESSLEPSAVAAQLDVLCEISYTFLTPNEEEKKETVTDLAVAVMEGWLKGGPENELRWKVAQLRIPHEFQYTPTVNNR